MAGNLPFDFQGLGLDQLTYEEIAKAYPFLVPYLTHPEVGPILLRAAKEGWDEYRLFGALYPTTWWQQTSAKQRQWDDLVINDPATAQAQRGQVRAVIVDEVTKSGVYTLTNGDVDQLTEQYLRNGWTEVQLNDAIMAKVTISGGNVLPGTLGLNQMAIRQMATQYMIPVSDEWVNDITSRIARGEFEPEAIRTLFYSQAKAHYPWMAEQIDMGLTPRDYYEPVINAVANTLELNPNSINLSSGKYAGLMGQGMSIGAAQAWARQQPEYMLTKQANDDAAHFAYIILQKLGALK